MVGGVFARRFTAVVATAVILASGLVTTAARAQSQGTGVTSQSTVHYAINKPLCATPKDPRTLRCFALERVKVRKGTRGAYAFTQPAALAWGPSGGFSPAMLAAAYGYNPDAGTKTQLVAIVDWHNDPNALSDLNHFDTTYGLPKETATSFRKVNQNGTPSPLPPNDQDAAGEIALDIEAVRGVCHTCRILLVEATAPNTTDTAAALNTAVRMGATEISNSYGAPEAPTAPAILAGYNHPGVVITASTGDQGWYGWTEANGSGSTAQAADAAYFPSTDPTVVGVGGTRLYVDSTTGDRGDEYVWNEEDVADGAWIVDGLDNGATGGGCSTVFAAEPWQAHTSTYPSFGCKGKRSAADISAVGDPGSGFDVYLTYGGSGWTTIGGTSLSSPVIAAMYALAGGGHGAAYPASTLYVNARLHPSSVYDVTNPGPRYDSAGGFIAGGNSWCAGDTVSDCETVTNSYLSIQNPNTYSPQDYFECSFPRTGLPAASALNPQCNAVAGFDGPSGLGTPAGLGVFARTAPTLTLTRPLSLPLNRAATFKAQLGEVLPGAHASSYTWNWGDGHTTVVSSSSASNTASHTYTKACSCTVTLSVFDSEQQQVVRVTRVVVGKAASVHYSGPSAVRVHHTGTFSAAGTSTPNTGAHVTAIQWNFGDQHASNGTRVAHTYARIGTFTITITVHDSTGVVTNVQRRVRVTN